MTDVDTLNDMLSRLVQLEERTTALAADLLGGAINELLFSGTVILDAAGLWVGDWRAPYGGVAVRNHSAALVTVANDATSSTPPTSGPGVALVGPAASACHALTGRQLALYGTARAAVGLEVYIRPQPPAFGSNR